MSVGGQISRKESRLERRWNAACCAMSRKRIPSMSWEWGQSFAAVASRRAHTAVNQPPSASTTLASQPSTAGSPASFQWEKKRINGPGGRDLCMIAKTLHINVIYWKMYAVVKTYSARRTLCWRAALLLTSLIGVISIIPFKWLPEVCWLK